jgi:hypothetical protein
MDRTVFLALFLLLISIIALVIWTLRSKFIRRLKIVLIAIPFLIILGFGLTYIPHQVVSIHPSEVSKITVFDGNTGYDMEITHQSDIQHIINNLNQVTFQKGKPSVGYMGFSFSTRIYNHNGKVIKELIINSTDTIRYKGFFYRDKYHSIDYKYIENLFRRNSQ